MQKKWLMIGALANCVLWLNTPAAAADVVTEWNATACRLVANANLPPPAAYRIMALTQTAVLAAVERAESENSKAGGGGTVSYQWVGAAVAAANRRMLGHLLPTQGDEITLAYDQALAGCGPAADLKTALAAGEAAAQEVLALRAGDGAEASETYRPAAAPGVYVPTARPVLPQWGARRPWVLASAWQFRPAPPPALGSNRWAADYQEVRVSGASASTSRTVEQTATAMFWEATAPGVYFSIVRSAAAAPSGRDVLRNARLFAAAGQAMDDALIATFDAKYHYQFWRPITAIRNGDRDENSATEREPGWVPLIETPMHPEYPAAHCALAGAVGAVLEADIGSSLPIELVAVSPKDPNLSRRWCSLEAFIAEVGDARIWAGVHYRNSTEMGTALGRQVGQAVAGAVFKAAAGEKSPDVAASVRRLRPPAHRLMRDNRSEE